MAKKEEEFDMFKLGFDGIVAEANKYLAEKAKQQKESQNNGKQS